MTNNVKIEEFVANNRLVSVAAVFGKQRQIIIVRRTGFSHIRTNDPCDDFGIGVIDPSTDVVALSVADGVGSNRNARFGSVAAGCGFILEFHNQYERLWNVCQREDTEASFTKAAVIAATQFAGHCTRERTLVFASRSPITHGGYELATTHIGSVSIPGSGYYKQAGDGNVFLFDGNSHSFGIDPNEKESSGTWTLQDDFAGRPLPLIEKSITTDNFMLATDGISDLWVYGTGGSDDASGQWVKNCQSKFYLLFLAEMKLIMSLAYRFVSLLSKVIHFKNGDDATMAIVRSYSRDDQVLPFQAISFDAHSLFSTISVVGKGAHSFCKSHLIEDSSEHHYYSFTMMFRYQCSSDEAVYRGQIDFVRVVQCLDTALVREPDFEKGLQVAANTIKAICESQLDALVVVSRWSLSTKTGDTHVYRKGSSDMVVLARTQVGPWDTLTFEPGSFVKATDLYCDLVIGSGESGGMYQCLQTIDRLSETAHTIIDYDPKVISYMTPGLADCWNDGTLAEVGSNSLVVHRNLWCMHDKELKDPTIEGNGVLPSKSDVVDTVTSPPLVQPQPPVVRHALPDKDGKLPKMVMDPAYKREYDNYKEPLPPNPDWIEIEGFGKVTRAEVLAGELFETKFAVQLPDGRLVDFALIPKNWRTILRRLG